MLGLNYEIIQVPTESFNVLFKQIEDENIFNIFTMCEKYGKMTQIAIGKSVQVSFFSQISAENANKELNG